ncbi:hypothetical protein [Nonomuraea diastatica]|uniref:Uncharacterized protein n=1 Tax=Nonomuraea diastatica TaxID=1848329 RepID=A0A4R4VYU2_9ACTN|nr:hypothetical protein [Nonomuraea diastatica]TDD11298.1 hypothetical protein E1294_45205 [Nonomuraea diastatica]
MFDDDFGAEAEAIATARMDADLEQAAMDAAGDALYAACDEMGICLHGIVMVVKETPVAMPPRYRCKFCRKAAPRQWFTDDRNSSYARLEEAGVL